MRTVGGRMYRVLGEEVVEFVKHGDEILAITDPRLNQTIGQLTMQLTYGEQDANNNQM